MFSTSRLKTATSHASGCGGLVKGSRPNRCAPAIARYAKVASCVITRQARLENTMPPYTGTIA